MKLKGIWIPEGSEMSWSIIDIEALWAWKGA